MVSTARYVVVVYLYCSTTILRRIINIRTSPLFALYSALNCTLTRSLIFVMMMTIIIL